MVFLKVISELVNLSEVKIVKDFVKLLVFGLIDNIDLLKLIGFKFKYIIGCGNFIEVILLDII